MPSKRPLQVADRIKELVANALESRVKDPRLGFVTITDVRVTGDLQQASVFYTVLGDAGRATGVASSIICCSSGGKSSTFTVCFGAAFFAGAFFAFGAASAGTKSGNLSINLRTTGASTVDDAERTNSPTSCSLDKSSLLSSPNSLANS